MLSSQQFVGPPWDKENEFEPKKHAFLDQFWAKKERNTTCQQPVEVLLKASRSPVNNLSKDVLIRSFKVMKSIGPYI